MSYGEIKIPIGIRTIDRREYPVHISEIKPEENGDDCNCVCPNCKAPLRARRGKGKHTPHFAHAYQTKCDHSAALESGLHLLAKQIIAENHGIFIPGVNESDSRLFEYNFVKSERYIGDRRPDAVIKTKKEELDVIVEVYVTNSVDDERIKRLKALGFPAFEIDLSDLLNSSLENLEAIENAILRDERRRKLLCHPIDERAIKYARELSSFRNDEQANRSLKNKFRFIEEYPFYMDIPITDEIVFSCDRRIWQGTIFRDYVWGYNNKQNYFNCNDIEKRLSCNNFIKKERSILLNGLEHRMLPLNVIYRYLSYLKLLGFISGEYYRSRKPNSIARYHLWFRSNGGPGSLAPPYRKAADILEKILESVNRFSPDIDKIIDDELSSHGLSTYNTIIDPF